ncbi:RNA-directed DNA polymerase, eukaryota [Tanacetum coccineum]
MDIVHEINVLKNQDLYPRIYALETCKFVKVGKKLTQSSLDFSFRRKPRGGIEQEQYEALLVQVQDVNLVPVSDRWKWSLENSGDFSVASVRKMLDDKMLPDVTTKTRWIKLVPIKVNVHAWKVKIDSLPTRFNISRRGMDIESITCSICDNEVESSSHLFFKCNMVRDIIRKITRWWDITYIEADSYEDWLNWLVNLRLSSNYKQALEVEGETHGGLGLRGGLLGVQTQSHIGRIIISKLTYKLGGLLLPSPISFRMEPQLGLYVRLGEMLGLGYPTSFIKSSGSWVLWLTRIDQEEVFIVWFFWKEQEGFILFGLPGSRQQKFLVLRFFDVKEQQGIDR